MKVHYSLLESMMADFFKEKLADPKFDQLMVLLDMD